MALTLFTLKTPERRSVKSMDWSIWASLLTAIMHHWLTFPFIIRSQSNIIYRPTEAAKIVFDYEIHDIEDDSLIATGSSVQVFMDLDYQLVWDNPPFYQQWKERWGQVEG